MPEGDQTRVADGGRARDSAVSMAKIAAYRAAWYRVDAPGGPIWLAVDRPCRGLLRLYHRAGVRQAAFITACNPFGSPAAARRNRQAQAGLAAALAQVSVAVMPGAGGDPSGRWPAEDSLLGLGTGYPRACALGRGFGQDALLWAAADAVPRLILLR